MSADDLMSIRVGDHVRWWPDGKDDDGRPVLDRHVDGVVERWARPHPMIRATASRGFAERCPGGWIVPAVGALMDTSVSPGAIERIARPYAPGEKMTDRHPDSVIAQETIAERVKHLATPIAVRGPYAPLLAPPEPAFRLFEQDGALYVDTKHGPFKLTEPLQKSAPAQPGRQWVAPVVYEQPEGGRRDDGFDQHQVDAAKAALLAPAPPRYPRSR